jgi:hypothetical protein
VSGMTSMKDLKWICHGSETRNESLLIGGYQLVFWQACATCDAQLSRFKSTQTEKNRRETDVQPNVKNAASV